ncbi:MAG: ATP-binding protein [Candidatus Binatia bacterium]
MMISQTVGDMENLELSVDAERRRMFTVRLRLLVMATIGIVIMFSLGNPAVHTGTTAPYFALRLLALAILGAFLFATYRPRFATYQQVGGIALATVIALLSARGGVLRGDIAVIATLHIILVMMTAAVLPWGVVCQAVVVLICGVSMSTAVMWIGMPRLGDVDVLVLINMAAGCLLSMFVSWQSRTTFDRAARENLRLRALEERNRSLNEELEAKVRARTAELEGTLADQREVTRAISHDLRQPLRHIEGYARMLEDDLGPTLSADHLDRLDRVRASTVRMGRMVDSLLALTRVSGRIVERHRFDMSACAAELCEEIRRAEPQRSVRCTIAPGLTDDCDPALTRDLLRELLRNSWKFTREQPDVHIEFGRRDGIWFVRDNGPGFDMLHTQRLFHAFERLHHVAEFEGEGMGLAIAERIVRSHGGRIWAESEPNHGATFLFTLGGES